MISRLFAVILLLLICYCAKMVTPTNPNDPNFVGDYAITYSISPQHSPLQVFFNYKLMVEDTGKNELKYFSPSATIDISPEFKNAYTFNEQPSFFFTHTGQCSLSVTGVSLNNKRITRGTSLPVINPYYIAIEDTTSLLKADSVRFVIKNAGTISPLQDAITVQWHCVWYKTTARINKVRELRDTLKYNNEFIIDNEEYPSYIAVSAQLLYETVKVPLDEPVEIDSLSPRLPTTFFQNNMESIDVDIGISIPIQIFFQNADTITVFSNGSDQEKKTVENSSKNSWFNITKTWNSADTDTLIISAKNKFQMISDPDTLVVIPDKYPLKLNFDNFIHDTLPETLRVDVETKWSVSVRREDIAIPDSLLVFFWKLSPLDISIVDTTTNGSTLKLLFRDDVDSMVISIRAVEKCGEPSCDSTREVSFIVRAKSYRPTISVTQEKDTVFYNDSLIFLVASEDDQRDGLNGYVDSIFYVLHSSPDDTIRSVNTDTISIQMTGPGGIDTVTFWCSDNEGYRSHPVHIPVMVKTDHPYFIYHKQTDTIYIGETDTVLIETVTGNHDVKIDRWYWDLDGDGEDDTSTMTNSLQFTGVDRDDDHDPDTVTVRVHCENEQGMSSLDTAEITVLISEGRPIIDSFKCITTTGLFINDIVTLDIKAHDPHGRLRELLFFLNDEPFDTLPFETPVYGYDSSYTLILPSDTVIKTYSLSVQARDDDRFLSNPVTLPESISVSIGRPVVNSLTPYTVWIHDDTTFTFYASDENGNVESYHYSIDGSDFIEQSGATIETAFTDSGTHEIRLYAEDNDGLLSDTLKQSVYVRYGQPKITGISISPSENNRYINNTISFTVTAADTQDAEVTIAVSWNNNGSFEPPTTGNDVVFTHPFADSGDKTVGFRVTDDDEISFDTTIIVTILNGTPQVSINRLTHPDHPDSLFVMDTIKFRVTGHDSNPDGNIVSFILRWEDDGKKDTVELEDSGKNARYPCEHAYDTTGGPKTVTVWAIDDDGVVSDSTPHQFTLKKGVPQLFGDSEDTLWVVVDSGHGIDYNLHVNSMDTNGTILKYYWNEAGAGITGADSTDIDSFPRRIGENDINDDFSMWIYALDDDGFLNGKQFTIFADSAPRQPQTVDDVNGSSVTIAWSGKDSKDQDNTLYSILLKNGGTPGDGDTLVSFNAGNSVTFEDGSDIGGNDFKYVFTPADGNGTYNYRVIAKDARGTIVESADQNFYYSP